MAPTIGRQWRGGPQDYAALCDYCDVRYFRSQLRKQSTGRLACVGPGTNSCGAGLDEVSLDKINADKMRHRRKPTKNAGGRFDRLRTSMEDIFGATLQEYWDARKGVVSSSDGALVSWTGQKLGMVFVPAYEAAKARWHDNRAEFGNRPAVEVTAERIETIPPMALMPLGAKPYVAIVAYLPFSVMHGGAIQFFHGINDTTASLTSDFASGDHNFQWMNGHYASLAYPYGFDLKIPQEQIGSRWQAQLFVLDAATTPTKLFAFRAGDAEALSGIDSPVNLDWDRVFIWFDSIVTLIVVANNPTAAQIAEFEALARSYAVRLP